MRVIGTSLRVMGASLRAMHEALPGKPVGCGFMRMRDGRWHGTSHLHPGRIRPHLTLSLPSSSGACRSVAQRLRRQIQTLPRLLDQFV
ncbi:MAG TPA: hypothetical protein PKW88_11265, partial [Plasticicumulans sp.]|nr:hypothetical protein [Plasticicumulans sp.]